MPTTLHESPSGSPVVVPDPTAPVISVFGRIGAVVGQLGDYVASLIGNNSGVAGASVAAALDTLAAAIAAIPAANPGAPTRQYVATQQFPDLQVQSGLSSAIGTLEIEFTNPLPTRLYSASILGEILQNAPGAGSAALVNVAFEVSIDNGPWVFNPLGEAGMQLITQSGNSFIRAYFGTLPKVLGSALGVILGTTSLRIRPIATGSAYDPGVSVFIRSQGSAGSSAFSASEYLP